MKLGVVPGPAAGLHEGDAAQRNQARVLLVRPAPKGEMASATPSPSPSPPRSSPLLLPPLSQAPASTSSAFAFLYMCGHLFPSSKAPLSSCSAPSPSPPQVLAAWVEGLVVVSFVVYYCESVWHRLIIRDPTVDVAPFSPLRTEPAGIIARAAVAVAAVGVDGQKSAREKAADEVIHVVEVTHQILHHG